MQQSVGTRAQSTPTPSWLWTVMILQGVCGAHSNCVFSFPPPVNVCDALQSTFGIASMARSAVLISRHAKAAHAHTAAVREADASA